MPRGAVTNFYLDSNVLKKNDDEETRRTPVKKKPKLQQHDVQNLFACALLVCLSCPSLRPVCLSQGECTLSPSNSLSLSPLALFPLSLSLSLSVSLSLSLSLQLVYEQTSIPITNHLGGFFISAWGRRISSVFGIVLDGRPRLRASIIV